MHQPCSLSRAQRFSNLKIPDQNLGHFRNSSNSMSKPRNNEVLTLLRLLDLNTVHDHYHLNKSIALMNMKKMKSLYAIQNISHD